MPQSGFAHRFLKNDKKETSPTDEYIEIDFYKGRPERPSTLNKAMENANKYIISKNIKIGPDEKLITEQIVNSAGGQEFITYIKKVQAGGRRGVKKSSKASKKSKRSSKRSKRVSKSRKSKVGGSRKGKSSKKSKRSKRSKRSKK